MMVMTMMVTMMINFPSSQCEHNHEDDDEDDGDNDDDDDQMYIFNTVREGVL